jgi:fumarate reductase flavoprotein subunit
VSINGANRLGSNSLTELLVFGARAGHQAASLAADSQIGNVAALEAQAAESESRVRALASNANRGNEKIAKLRDEMTVAMEGGAGIYRTEKSLRAACDKLVELRSRFDNVSLDDSGRRYNTELIAALELDCMLDVAQSVAFSAIARKESRGSHQRTDFPNRDDDDYLKHSLAYRADGDPRIDYKPVTITKWPPGKRVYGS